MAFNRRSLSGRGAGESQGPGWPTRPGPLQSPRRTKRPRCGRRIEAVCVRTARLVGPWGDRVSWRFLHSRY